MSAYVFSRRSGSKTWTLKVFLLFGLLTALWEFATFFQRTAPAPDASAFFFYVLLVTSSLSQPAYLLTVLSIQREKRSLLFVFFPVLIRFLSFFFLTITFVLTPYGWSYLISPALAFDVGTVVFFGYLFAAIIILVELARKARSAILRRKYIILLASFTLFQAIGFPLTNYILTVNPDFPPLGGILQFLTFIAIGVAVLLKEPRLPSSISGVNSFQEVYLSFLTDFYNSTIDTNLGEASFKFADFLHHSLIDDKVSISEKKITFETDDLDLPQLINRNLKFLEDSEDNKLTDSYLRVLDAAHLELRDDFDVCGTDISNFGVKVTKYKVKCPVEQGNCLEGLPFNGKFDIITAIDILEHLPDPTEALKHIYNRLTDDGYLYFEVPTINNKLSQMVYDMFFAKDETHIFIKSVKEFEDLVNSVGFRIQPIRFYEHYCVMNCIVSFSLISYLSENPETVSNT